MSITVDLDDERNARVARQEIAVRSGETVDFTVHGTLSVTESVLEGVAGTAMTPAQVGIAVGGETVEIDLEDEASLRLEDVDVGIATPDRDDVSTDAIRSGLEDRDVAPDVGAIAVTVEGVIEDVPEPTAARLDAGEPSLSSITFSIEDATRADGGSDDVVAEFALLGFGIVVRVDGTIAVGTGDRLDRILP